MQLTIDKLIPSQPGKTGKMRPPQAKVGETYYTVNQVLFNELQEGMTYECTTSSKVNGQYTNWLLDSATPVQSPQPTQNASMGHTTPNTAYSDRDRSIVLQVCMKCAAEIFAAEAADSPMKFAAIADQCLNWYDSKMGVTTDKADPFSDE